jgi:hypothetical protein
MGAHNSSGSAVGCSVNSGQRSSGHLLVGGAQIWSGFMKLDDAKECHALKLLRTLVSFQQGFSSFA